MLDLLGHSSAACALAGVLGLIVGSFLNVVILRLPARLIHSWRQQSREILELPELEHTGPPSIVWEPSHCPRCKHTLGALENIPLFGWIFLRGRCKHCRAQISIQYPLVELLTALISIAVIWRFGATWQGGAGLIFSWTIIALSGIDLRTQLLPDQLTLPLLWLGLLLAIIDLYVSPGASIIGAALGYLSLWTVYWLFKLVTGKEGMGYGDFKLLGALGAWMGPASLLPIVLLSSMLGAIIGGAFLVVRGRDRATPIPFGPFIATAGWMWFIYGRQFLDNYWQIVGER